MLILLSLMQYPPPLDSYWAAKSAGGATDLIFSASNFIPAGPDSIAMIILRLLEPFGINR